MFVVSSPTKCSAEKRTKCMKKRGLHSAVSMTMLILLFSCQKPELLLGLILSSIAVVSCMPLWMYKLATEPRLSAVLTTHLVTEGKHTRTVANALGFDLENYNLSTPGFDGAASDLTSYKGSISNEALQAAQDYFRHVVPKVLETPDKRLIMNPSRLASIHPELADFVASDGGASLCHVFATTQAYDFNWHSDSHVMALDNKFVQIFGSKRMRIMPFESSLGWEIGEPCDWLEYKGEPTRGIIEDGITWTEDTFAEGDVFTQKGLNLHEGGSELSEHGTNVMIVCHSNKINPHPFAWIPALKVWHYSALEAKETLRMYWNNDTFSFGGNGDGFKSRVHYNTTI